MPLVAGGTTAAVLLHSFPSGQFKLQMLILHPRLLIGALFLNRDNVMVMTGIFVIDLRSFINPNQAQAQCCHGSIQLSYVIFWVVFNFMKVVNDAVECG